MEFTPKENFIISQETINAFRGGPNKLLPCPFCGCEFVSITGRKNTDTGNVVFHASCMAGVFECGANIFTCVKNTPEQIESAYSDLTKRWNTRTTPL